MLIGISGNVGSGKTLLLTYLGIKEYLQKNNIFANYTLYGMNYSHLTSPSEFDELKEGIFLGDELWLWADSRQSMSKKNRFITKILAKSRHKKIDIIYTTQDFRQMDARIRRITDIWYFPRLIHNNKICKYDYNNLRTGDYGSRHFPTKIIFGLYDTYEDLSYLEE